MPTRVEVDDSILFRHLLRDFKNSLLTIMRKRKVIRLIKSIGVRGRVYFLFNHIRNDK